MPDLNLADHADLVPDPSLYFVDSEGRDRPLVVEHATGRPAFVYDPTDGSLTPYPAPGAGPDSPAVGASIVARPGAFAFGGEETPKP